MDTNDTAQCQPEWDWSDLHRPSTCCEAHLDCAFCRIDGGFAFLTLPSYLASIAGFDSAPARAAVSCA